MAKTVFDSSELKRAERQKALEAELAAMKAKPAAPVVHKKHRVQAQQSAVQANQAPAQTKTSTKSPNMTATANTAEHTHPHVHKHRRPEEYSQVLRDENGTPGAFSSFIPQPKNMHFESQHEKEQVLLVLRQHPILNLPWILLSIFLLLAPLVIFPFLPIVAVFPGIFSLFATLVWYLLVTAYIIESFLYWYFNIYIITDERIIDVDFYNLIYKEVSEAKIDRIEDVTATTAGFWGAIFDFGTISIQTAAEKRQFSFAAVPQPAKVTKFLNELILEEEREKIEGRVM